MNSILLIGEPDSLVLKTVEALKDKKNQISFIDSSRFYSSKDVEAAAEKETGSFDKVIIDLHSPSEFQGKNIEDLSEDEWKRYKYRAVKLMYDIGRFFLNSRLNEINEVFTLFSIGGVLPVKENMLICGADASAKMFTKVMAEELSIFDIAVNGFAVGYNDCGYGIKVDNEKELLEHIPAHKMINADAAAKRIAALVCEEKYLETGNIYKMDGAFSIGYMREY